MHAYAASLGCRLQRTSHQTIQLRYGEFAPSCSETGCMKCVCTYNGLSCTSSQGSLPDYALDERGGNCLKDGRTIHHGEQVMVSCRYGLMNPSIEV